ncbi:hypothetical protein [Modicisalibacter coralii]|uniref:hypothetical protein n=1 Tax=Modicisalibacter coralii TaxID=2304602 RepID=UPI00100B8048|nr:hypothetical protein [Halomonas coralii]
MAVFNVSYDLQQPETYEGFYSLLESFPHDHIMDGCWLVESDDDAGSLRDQLKAHIHGQDAVFVVRIGDDWAGAGTQCGGWLNAPERRFS